MTMKNLIQQTVELLRAKVLKNLEIVRATESEVREIMKQPISNLRTKTLNGKYEISKRLLSENNDFINLQLTLLNFLNKYKESFEKEAEMLQINPVRVDPNISKEECFKLTIEKKISFDHSHPFYNNEEFFNDLISHYQTVEDYESCAQLMALKKY